MDTRGLSVSPEISGLPEVLMWGNRRDKGHGEQALSTCKLMGRRLPSPRASSNLLEPDLSFQDKG